MRNYAASEIDVTHFPFFQPNPCIRMLGTGLKKKNDYSQQKLRKIRWLHLTRPVTFSAGEGCSNAQRRRFLSSFLWWIPRLMAVLRAIRIIHERNLDGYFNWFSR